jgi:hypothetical protein
LQKIICVIIYTELVLTYLLYEHSRYTKETKNL